MKTNKNQGEIGVLGFSAKKYQALRFSGVWGCSCQMAEPDKPPDQKLSPWKQFLEDASWDILFFRAFWNLLLEVFFEEGKAVRSGWFAFALFTGIAFWGGWHYSERHIDEKFASITNDFSGKLKQQDDKILELNGQLADKDKMIFGLRQALANRATSYTPAQLMGLEEITNIFNITNYVIPKINPNIHLFTFRQLEAIKSKIQASKPVEIAIACTTNNSAVAVQLMQVFEDCQFPIFRSSLEPENKELKGVYICYGKAKPSQDVIDAMTLVNNYLGIKNAPPIIQNGEVFTIDNGRGTSLVFLLF